MSELVRFGVAMEQKLLTQFDALVEARGSTRSEALRDLVRAEVVRSHVERGVDAFGSLSLVFRASNAEVQQRLAELYQGSQSLVRSSQRTPLGHDFCMEVLVLQGPSSELRALAERLLATRGVKHGGLELITDITKHAPSGHAEGGHG